MKNKSRIKKYSHNLIHNFLSKMYGKSDTEYGECQALSCPYYVPLTGVLGADWGIIVNPESEKFGQIVFEHDWCGCEKDFKRVEHDKDYQEIEDAWKEKE